MLQNKINSKMFIPFFLLFNMLTFFPYHDSIAYDFPSWEHGAGGYEFAYSHAIKNEKPLIVYFHIEGSVWNQRMNDEYLASVLIDDFLMDIPKVEINGEGEDSEKKLVSKYGVKQFPAFFVLAPSFNNEHKRIHPFSETEMSVEDFLKKLKDIIVYQYNLKAFKYFEEKEYDNALKYYKMSSHYNPEDSYTYYAVGTIYNYKYYNKKKSIEFLKNARDSYKKAIELNPGHEESLIELEKVQKELDKQLLP